MSTVAPVTTIGLIAPNSQHAQPMGLTPHRASIVLKHIAPNSQVPAGIGAGVRSPKTGGGGSGGGAVGYAF